MGENGKWFVLTTIDTVYRSHTVDILLQLAVLRSSMSLIHQNTTEKVNLQREGEDCLPYKRPESASGLNGQTAYTQLFIEV